MEDYFEDDDPIVRHKIKKRLIKVTFPDGKSVCYSKVAMTFMEVLRRIGVEKLQRVDFKVSTVPFLSQALDSKYQKYQHELVPGWYVMVRGDSGQLFRQLLAIKDMLELDFEVELGSDLEADKVKLFSKSNRAPKTDMLVTFPDGEFVGNINPIDTYKETLQKIGIDDIVRRRIELGGKPLIATSKLAKGYEEIEPGRWLYIPSTTKDKAKFLKVVGAFMHVSLEITII